MKLSKSSTNNRRKGLAAAVCAIALGGISLLAIAGCSFTTVTNTQVNANKTPTITSGTTITDGVLTVGINASNTPYGGLNSENETIGLDVDTAAAIADELGCKVKIEDVGADGKKALLNGEVDVVMGASKQGNNTDINYSESYMTDGASLFCLVSNRPDNVADADLTGSTVLVQADSAACYKMQDALGVKNVVVSDTMKSAFQDLEDGKGKYLVANAVIGDYYARDYQDIVRVNFLSQNDVTPVYAITKVTNAELSLAVNNAVTSINSNGVMKTIAGKWLGTQNKDLLPANVSTDSLPKVFSVKKSNKATE